MKILPAFLLLLVSSQAPVRAQEVGGATSATELSGDLQLFLGALQKTVDETVASKEGQKPSLQIGVYADP